MRGFRKKCIWPTAFAGAALLTAYVAFVSGRTQTVRLPNGTELLFVAMTCGPTNACFPGGILDRLKYRLLPSKGIRVGPLKIAAVVPLVDVSHYSVRLECSGRNTIRVKLNPSPQGCRLRLVEIVDDQGGKVEHSSGGFGDSQFEAQWVIPPKAESIKVTISLPEIRVFEFLAQPVRR